MATGNRCCAGSTAAARAAPTVICGPPIVELYTPTAGKRWVDTSDPANPISYTSNGTGWVVTGGHPISREIYNNFLTGSYSYNKTTPTAFGAEWENKYIAPLAFDADGLITSTPANPWLVPIMIPTGHMFPQLSAMLNAKGALIVCEFTPDAEPFQYGAGGWGITRPSGEMYGNYWVDPHIGNTLPYDPLHSWPSIALFEQNGLASSGLTLPTLLPGTPLGTQVRACALLNFCANYIMLAFSGSDAEVGANAGDATIYFADTMTMFELGFQLIAGCDAHTQLLGVYPINVPLAKYPALSTVGAPMPSTINPL